MQLYVRGLDGASTAHLVDPQDTLGALKQRLQASLGIPVDEQLLTSLGGRPLSAAGSDGDDMPLAAVPGLSHGATLQLLLRLRGGKGGFGALLRGQGRDGKITDNFDACRDLSGRRIRQVEAEKKLKQWEAEAKERELEKLAMKHMKEMARAARRERNEQELNLDEVRREHQEAAERVAEAVHTALAEGLGQQKQPARGGGSGSSSADGSGSAASTGTGGSGGGSSKAAEAAAAAAAAGGGSKRKQPAGGEEQQQQPAGSPPKKKRTMLDMVEGLSDDDNDDSDSE